MLRAFPKMLIAVILYNALVFGGGAMHHQAADLLAQNFPVTVVSGDVWKISVSDALVALSLVLLFIEIIKATRTSRREILNQRRDDNSLRNVLLIATPLLVLVLVFWACRSGAA